MSAVGAHVDGTGDGLPLIARDDAEVARWLAGAGLADETVIGELPFLRARCTAGDVARTAYSAGAPEASLAVLLAAVAAITEPGFQLEGGCTTTESAVPAIVVNGPRRDQFGIPYSFGCLGGASGPGAAIGRALQLLVRNVFGQVPGESSWSVFGQPARVTGMVFAEWEERSPWPSLATRRGVAEDAVTAFPAQGTIDIVDVAATDGPTLLEIVGKALANPATPTMLSPKGGEVLVALCPTWAELVARDVPDIDDVAALVWEHAALPLSWWPSPHRERMEQLGKVDERGVVHLVARPEDVIVTVCGGTGGLHATGIHGWPSRSVTKPVAPVLR